MKRKRSLIAGLSAMRVAAALVAVSAVASSAPSQAASDAAPTIRVRDTGDSFIVRWTAPEGVGPQDRWTTTGLMTATVADPCFISGVRRHPRV